MVEKVSLSVAIIAILISAGSIAYSSNIIGGISGQVDQAKKDISNQLTSQAGQVNSKISPLESSVNTVKQEQTAIRSLVDQRIGGLEKSLQEAQQRLAQAEKVAQQSQAELDQLKAERALEDAAKKEKVPLIYGNLDAPHIINIVWPRFRESYPWVPAEPKYIEGFAPLRGRFVTEFQAGAPSADIVWQTPANMIGELAPYFATVSGLKYVELFPDAVVYPSKKEILMISTHTIPEVIAYNANIVKDDDAPKGWLELANPKWKGKIVMQDPRRLDASARALADLLTVLNRDQWNTFMKGLAANNPTYVGSFSESYTKVVAGEFPVGMIKINDILAQKPGTPVKVAWPKEAPIGLTPGLSSMIAISKKAANPNFAKLFMQWTITPAGQRAIAETGRPPSLLSVDHPNSLSKVLPAGIGLFPLNTEFIKNPKSWEPIINSFFS